MRTDLKLVLVTAPQAGPGIPALARDVELVRAAVLYADEIELVSPAAALMTGAQEFARGHDTGILLLMASMDDATVDEMSGGQLPPNWREMLSQLVTYYQLPREERRKAANRETREAMKELDNRRHLLEEALAQFRESADQMVLDAGGRELRTAVEAQVVTMSPFEWDSEGDLDKTTLGYIDQVGTLLKDATKHVLIDGEIQQLFHSAVDAGWFTPSGLAAKHAGQAAVGTGLVARLPTFPGAPIDELLDVRRDLHAPLLRYRRAVAGLSKEAGLVLFDDEADAKVNDLWNASVAPAIEDLHGEMREHGFVREFGAAAARDVKKFAGGGIGGGAIYFGVDKWPALSTVVAAAVAVGPAAQTALNAQLQRRRGQADARHHDLYYLCEVNERLR